MLPTFCRGTREHQLQHMIKILFFGRSCKAYLRLYRSDGPHMKLCCDHCSHRLHKHGRYYRWVTTKREMIEIPIYRWLCPHCRTTVSVLPDFLIPWARFTTWVREAAVVRKRQGRSNRRITESISTPSIGLSTTTVKRWWKRHRIKASVTGLWICGQLVAAGWEDDLIRMHPQPVNPMPTDTILWFEQLQKYYTSKTSHLRGYWSLLNARLPLPYVL